MIASPHVPAGDGHRVWFLGNLMTIKAGAPGEDPITFIEGTLHPGHAPPLHVHHGEDEAFYVLEGEVRFRCGAEEFDAGPGDFVLVPRGTAHAFRVGERGARTLMVGTSCHLAAFMAEAGEPARRPALPDRRDHGAERIAEAAARHDMTIVGPPLERGPAPPAR